MKIRLSELCHRALSRRRSTSLLRAHLDPIYEIKAGHPHQFIPSASSQSAVRSAEPADRWRSNRLRKRQSFLKAPGSPASESDFKSTGAIS